MAGLQTIASLLIKVGVDPSAVESGMREAEASIGRHAGAMSKVGKVVGGALAGGLGYAAKASLEAEEAMARFQAETGASADEARAFGDAVNAMSGATTIAYSQIAESATRVRTDLGLMGAEADATTARFIKYQRATAQGADSVLAFDDILDAWNLEATDAAGIMDVLIASHQKYGGSIAANQAILADLAPALQAANMSWEQGQGLLNLFARAGVSGEGATTAFNRALMAVKSPEELTTLLEEISLQPDAFKRAQMAAEVFGTRAGTKLGQALADAEGDLGAFIVTTEDAAGATDKANDALENTWGSKFTRLMNGAKAGLRGLGMEFGPVLTGAAAMVSLGQTLGVGRFLPAGLGGKLSGVIKGGLAAGFAGASRLAGPLTSAVGAAMEAGMSRLGPLFSRMGDTLGKTFGGKFGSALKVAGLLALGVLIAQGIADLARLREANTAKAAANTDAMAKLLAEAPTRAEAEAKLAGLRAIPENLDGIQGAVLGFSDFAKGNVLGSAVDGLFGSNPAQNLKDQTDALEAYIATLPADIGGAAAAAGAATAAAGDAVAGGVKSAWAAARAATQAEGKRLVGSMDAAATKVGGAWDAITNALSKGPKLMGFKERMAQANKAVRANLRMLGKALRMGDTVGAQEYANRVQDASSARHTLKATAEGTLADAAAVFARARQQTRRHGKAQTRDMGREGRRQTRAAEKAARRTANATPDKLTEAEPKVATAAANTADAVRTPLTEAAMDATTWGSHLGANFAAGVSSQYGAAVAAAATLAGGVRSRLGFSAPPKHGPLHDIDKWGEHMVVRWVRPVHRGRDKAERAGRDLADAMGRGMNRGGGRRRWGSGGGGGSGSGSRLRVQTLHADRLDVRRGGGGGGEVHIHVGTLIANDHGLDELERRMDRRARMRRRDRRLIGDQN